MDSIIIKNEEQTLMVELVFLVFLMQTKIELLSWRESECDAAITTDPRNLPSWRPGYFYFDVLNPINFF